MSLLQLRSFVEVYRQKSLSGAARSLGLTQPAISQHIAALESAVGHPLFLRHAKGVSPTASADELAANLGDRLETAEAVLAQARARSSDMTGTVRIMGQADFLAAMVVPLLMPLLQSGMQFHFRAVDREEMNAAFSDGQCDLAVSGYPLFNRKVRSELVHEEPLRAVAAPDVAGHLMAQPDLATALGKEPVLAFDLEQRLIQSWLDVNDMGGERMRAAVTGQDLRSLQGLLLRGFGWSVLPHYLCGERIAAGELVEIAPPVTTPVNCYYLLWAPQILREPRVAVAHAELRKAFCALSA